MNSISHRQARNWVQAQLDGHLDKAKTSTLRSHLQDCAACQAYASELGQLDSALRQSYRERVLALRPTPSRSFSADSTIHILQGKMRLKMKSKQFLTVTNSIAFVAAMALLAVGLSLIISLFTRGGQVEPAGGRPFVPSPTPFPWTEDKPLTDPVQIQEILTGLAQENLNAFQTGDWVHIQQKDIGGPGMLRSSYSDSWFRYPKDDQICIERLDLVKNLPEDDSYYQILVGLSDGTTGDLFQLRAGAGEVSKVEPGSSSCRLAQESTPASQLAARLMEEQVALQDEPMKLDAWYAELDGRVVFTVSATFTQPSKANATGILKETHVFDGKTGMPVQEGIRMEWEDGSLFGETLQGYKTEFYSELPAEAATRFEQFSVELRSYAGRVALSTPTPQVSQQDSQLPEISLESLTASYTEENPLTDIGTITQVLSMLEDRQVARLLQPGWYVYGPNEPRLDDWMRNLYWLTHTLDGSGACEYMIYYIKDGVILPNMIVLSDGRWGLIGVVDGGKVSMGETGKINWSNGPMTDTCHVENTETVSFVRNEAGYFQGLVNSNSVNAYKAWAQEMEGRRLFVLYYELQGGLGHVMDPDTRTLEPIDHTQKWVYFDLDWGTVLSEAGDEIYTLQNGKVIGSAPAQDKAIDVGYTFYESLPPSLMEAYERTVAALEKYLQK